jgi:hypothetical protein
MSASDASVFTFGTFCVLAVVTMVATFWKKSNPEDGDNASKMKAGADRLRATLSQFKMSKFQKIKKWLSLLHEFIQVRKSAYLATHAKLPRCLFLRHLSEILFLLPLFYFDYSVCIIWLHRIVLVGGGQSCSGSDARRSV